MYQGYAEGITLDLPEYLTKDDEACLFILHQPRAPEPAAEPVADVHPENKDRPAVRRALLFPGPERCSTTLAARGKEPCARPWPAMHGTQPAR